MLQALGNSVRLKVAMMLYEKEILSFENIYESLGENVNKGELAYHLAILGVGGVIDKKMSKYVLSKEGKKLLTELLEEYDKANPS